MIDSDAEFPDDVPVADAVEQWHQTAEFPDDDGCAGDVPLETSAPDWQEQRETVPIDPEVEEFGYRG
ncbi:hypothetical protein [Mycobacterium servetii]|uniref:Uncharacterized protein n=1 Tax=Mycobacterium servetii TaxID=3237418 RepID=A0ABV4C3D5_9MYCO